MTKPIIPNHRTPQVPENHPAGVAVDMADFANTEMWRVKRSGEFHETGQDALHQFAMKWKAVRDICNAMSLSANGETEEVCDTAWETAFQTVRELDPKINLRKLTIVRVPRGTTQEEAKRAGVLIRRKLKGLRADEMVVLEEDGITVQEGMNVHVAELDVFPLPTPEEENDDPTGVS